MQRLTFLFLAAATVAVVAAPTAGAKMTEKQAQQLGQQARERIDTYAGVLYIASYNAKKRRFKRIEQTLHREIDPMHPARVVFAPFQDYSDTAVYYRQIVALSDLAARYRAIFKTDPPPYTHKESAKTRHLAAVTAAWIRQEKATYATFGVKAPSEFTQVFGR